jgi:triacylglycerol lipase
MNAVADRLQREGRTCHSFDLQPFGGRAPILDYARQVAQEVDRVRASEPVDRVDVVGMSMGTVVLRAWIQLLEGWRVARRFVSLAGPHRGTKTAYLSGLPASRDLRPDSPLLARLNGEPDPWRGVEAFSFWTPFDLMIVPGHSGRLPGARLDRKFPVPLHTLMVYDRRVLDAVADALVKDEPVDGSPTIVGE